LAPGSWIARHEAEMPGLVGARADRPAGQDAGERADVLLAIAAIDAERVQLQQLAAEILVEPALAA
jgi:hypothetical protein